MVEKKGKLDTLQAKRDRIANELNSINSQISTVLSSVGKVQKIAKKKPAARPKIKKAKQPALATLITEILKEKKKPQSVKEIGEALLQEKKYKTTSKNFSNQLRVLLYQNKKGLFKKTGPGSFTLK